MENTELKNDYFLFDTIFGKRYLSWSCILYPEFCILYLVPCILYLASCILYFVPCIIILSPESCILYPLHCILILFHVHCILNYLYRILYFTEDDTPYFLNTSEPYITVVEGGNLTLHAVAFGAPTPWVTITKTG